MGSHSAIVGGSTAGRLLNCPASYQATLALPSAVETTSEYAEEGTFAHACMDTIMRARLARQKSDSEETHMYEAAGELLGSKVYDRVVTQAHLDDMINPAIGALIELETLHGVHGDDFTVAGVELSSQFPGIPGAFGTCDLILRSSDTVMLVDWKFGAGVPVKAVYDHGDSETVNPQLMFYAAAAMNSRRDLFKGAKILVVAIIQPRADEPLSHTTVTRRDIRWFTEDLQAAVVTATDRDPPRHKGEHCRFAPCKLTCPLWTGPLLDMTAIGVVPRTEPVAKEITPYAEYLARAKALADMLAMFKKEVDEQLHAYLEDGGTVPGWKLKAKVKQRVWVDEDAAARALKARGFTQDEIWQKKLQTFASVDATAKRRGVEIPAELRQAPPTSETTVTTSDDPAPAVERALVIEQFQASLRQLKAET